MEDRQPVAITEENLSLSSQQINGILGSGGGLLNVSSEANYQRYDTAQDSIAQIKSSGQYDSDMASLLTQWLAAGRPVGPMVVGAAMMDTQGSKGMQSVSDDEVQSWIGWDRKYAAEDAEEASSMQVAYDNHEMTLAKAIDVPGLDYSDTETYVDHGGFEGNLTGQQSYNSAMLCIDAEGTQHDLLSIGGVAVYASWPSQEETVTEVSVTQTTRTPL